MAYNTSRREGESLEQQYRRLAKVADQRLVQLESYTHDKNYKSVKQYAYARAIRDIKVWSGEGARRFNTKPPANTNQLKAKINDIIEFIDAPTSTKTGITNIYKKRADTLNAKNGTNFTWNELATFFESQNAKNLSEKIPNSSVMVKAIGAIKRYKNDDELINAIKESNKTTLRVSEDEIVDSVAKKLIREGLTYDDLF